MPPMQERQRIERREQQFPYFLMAQGAPAQNLGERLFRIFHDHEDKLMLPSPIPPHLEQADQMRMSKLGRRAPLRKQRLRLRRIRPHEPDRGGGEVFCLIVGKEDRVMFRCAEQPA